MSRHHLISSNDLIQPSSISNQRGIQPRQCKFAESSNRRRDVANSRWITQKIRSRSTILEFPKDVDFRHKISTKLDCSANKRLFWRSKVTFNRRRTITRSDTHSSKSQPRLNAEATALGLYAISRFRGRGGRALRTKMRPDFKPR